MLTPSLIETFPFQIYRSKHVLQVNESDIQPRDLTSVLKNSKFLFFLYFTERTLATFLY